MESEIKQDAINYKIMAGRKYRVFKLVFDDKVFYRIQMQQKNYDDTVSKFYRQVNFKKGVELDNETDIIIHRGFENVRRNPKDDYNPISSIMITDFEIVENQEKVQKDALEDYNKQLEEANNLIDDEDFPF